MELITGEKLFFSSPPKKKKKKPPPPPPKKKKKKKKLNVKICSFSAQLCLMPKD